MPKSHLIGAKLDQEIKSTDERHIPKFELMTLNRPCGICGSDLHGVEVRILDNWKPVGFCCPISIRNDLENTEPRSRNSHLQYQPCYRKIAASHGYNDEGINKAINDIQEKGYGRYMSTTRISWLRLKALGEAARERSKWTFKRENRSTNDYSSEEEGDQNS